MSVFEERGITHLDLHGTKHQDVESAVINFVYQYQDLLPLIIICGNSNKMIDIASSALTSSIFRSHHQDLELLELRVLTEFDEYCKLLLNCKV